MKIAIFLIFSTLIASSAHGEEFENNMGKLNPSEQTFADSLEAHKKAHPGLPLHERTLDDLRKSTKVFLQYTGNHAPVSFVDEQIPTRDGSLITLRIFNNHLPDQTPVLIFYPGCAFIFDLFEVNSTICSRIAHYSGIKIILVQFRLAPENPMPTSIYDGFDAAVHIAANSEHFGIDRSKIFLGGWCSGAQCAAAVSTLLRQDNPFHVYHQILLSGSYDLTESNHDFDEYEKEDKIVSRKFTAHIAKQYYGITPNDYFNPLLSPYHEGNFTSLPSTTILCGEYDALRNDSEAYYGKLKENGILVEKIILPGQTHDTIAMRAVLTDGQDPAEVIADIITHKLYQSRLKTSLLSASKFPGFDDRKWVHISNIDPLTIVESRVFHAAEK